MLYRRKQKLFTLLDTVRDMLRIIDTLTDRRSAFADCIEATAAVEAVLWQESPLPSRSLDMLPKLREDFESLMSRRITRSHAESLIYYLECIRECMRAEVEVRLCALFMPHKASRWPDMEPLYNAVVSDGGTALVVPIPYLVPREDDSRLICEYAMFPDGLPLMRYRDCDMKDEQPDLLVFGDLSSTAIKIHRPFTADRLKGYACLTMSLPSLQGLPQPVREAGSEGGEELYRAIKKGLK